MNVLNDHMRPKCTKIQFNINNFEVCFRQEISVHSFRFFMVTHQSVNDSLTDKL